MNDQDLVDSNDGSDVAMGEGAGGVDGLDPNSDDAAMSGVGNDNDAAISGVGNDNDAEMSDIGNDDDDDDDGSGTYFPGEGGLADDDSSEEEGGSESEDLQKAEWTEEMVQTAEMAKLGICINTVAKVIVCLACSSVLRPSEFSQHLSSIHKPISSTPSFFEQLVETYGLRENLSSRPGAIITAIYGLNMFPGFLTCDDCGYACRTVNRITTHLSKSRGCETFSEKRLVQTFQPTSDRMYFGVEPHPVADELNDPFDPFPHLKIKHAPPSFADIPITSPKSARDANNFLRSEPWLALVDGKKGRDIYDLVRERDPDLRQEVRICVERYAMTAGKALEDAGHEAGAAMADYVG